MKVYKKYDTDKNKSYNLLAKEYLELNNIKCKTYAWIGMAADCDMVIADKKTYKFNINTKQRVV